jgi:hypothetical protein
MQSNMGREPSNAIAIYNTNKSIPLRAITAAFVNRPRTVLAIDETKEDSIGHRWNARGG